MIRNITNEYSDYLLYPAYDLHHYYEFHAL